MKKAIFCRIAGAIGLIATCNTGWAKNSDSSQAESIKTEAGTIDFRFTHYIRHPSALNKIAHLSTEDGTIELGDGSKWAVSKIDLVKGWDKTKHLVVGQNLHTLSTHRYALINTELKLAIPMSLVREPIPSKDGGAFYVKAVDHSNDIVVLSDGKNWIVNSSDKINFHKVREHDRMIVGVNIADKADASPYILIDTANGMYMRANPLN